MSREQKKDRIIKRAIKFGGLTQIVANELSGEVDKLSVRKLRRVIGAIQHGQKRGLLMLNDLVEKALIRKENKGQYSTMDRHHYIFHTYNTNEYSRSLVSSILRTTT